MGMPSGRLLLPGNAVTSTSEKYGSPVSSSKLDGELPSHWYMMYLP